MKNIKLHIVFALVILTGIAFPVWRNVLDNQFLYDDDTFVVLNESIRTLTPATKFFSPDASSNNPQMNRDVWRPLTTFSYAVNYALSGLSPRAFHLFNLLGHILNGLLVFLMAQNMMLALSMESKASPLPPGEGRVRALFPFIVSLIFLIHPVQAETVAWVSQRSNILFMVFYLLAIISYQLRGKAVVGAGFSRALDTSRDTKHGLKPVPTCINPASSVLYPVSLFLFILSLPPL